MAEPQDVDALRRRGRRRLIGAIALVLLAIIVLPMVFEQRPRQTAPVSVRIPSENEGGLSPQAQTEPAPAAVPSPAPAPGPALAAAPAPTPAASPAPAEKPGSPKVQPAPQQSPAPEPKANPESHAPAKGAGSEHARPAAAPAGKEFIVPVAALAEQERVRALTARLRSAKLPYYTEAINTKHGKVTRIRVGPFRSREAAERAHANLQKLGLKPGPVATTP